MPSPPTSEAGRPHGREFDLVCMGEAMVEFNQGTGEHWIKGFGGDTSNCAIAAARLGARVAYATRVGADEFGEDLLGLWRREGVDTRAVERAENEDTGLYFVSHGAGGHRFTYRRAGSAASRMQPQGVPRDLIARSAWLHVSGISQAISANCCEAVFEAAAHARAVGTRLSYDLNWRPRLWPRDRALAAARQMLREADLFLPSVDEIEQLTGLAEPRDIIRWAHDQGARHVVLKLGSRGALASDGTELVEIAPHPVIPVDATGAGDAFAGALLARLAAGAPLAAAARAASVAAALSTTAWGAVAGLPRWGEVVGYTDW